MSDHPALHRRGYPAAGGPLGKLIELVVQRLALAHDVAAVKYWHAHPEEVPSAYLSLAAEVRPRLDRITTQIMLQFESVAKMPRVSFGAVADLVDERLATEASARQLPRLHRAAALFAMRSLCAEAPRVPQAARCGPASFLPPFLVGPAEGQS
jgi:hypothetical protein